MLLALVILGACTEHTLPIFENPQPISVPSGKPAFGPRLAKSDDNQLVLSWMHTVDEAPTLRFSTLYEESWSPAMTAASDSAMFINWADLPAVTPISDGRLLAHWLSYTADAQYAYQILTVLSEDGGASWSAPVSPHSDGTPTEHGFVSVYTHAAQTDLLWLDGRNTPDGGMTLRGGDDETSIDDLVCDCCQTDVAIAKSGPIAIYRNRTEEEVRDIYVARQLDGEWQPGVAIFNDGWVISGCPVNGPSIAADQNIVVAAWFTAAGGEPVVKVAISKDSGQSFSDPIEVSGAGTVGHVSVAIITRESFAVSWMESSGNGEYAIQLRAITVDGQSGPARTVGRTSIARNFPQMELTGDNLILAWTDAMDDESKVVSVKVRIRGFYD